MAKLYPRGRNDGHKLDYSKITENIYVGSDFCNGRDCKEHAGEFKKLEIDVEINLTAEKKETPPDGVNSYTWIPVIDGYAPSQEQLDIGTAIINQATKNGEKVYVHCKNGHGRSPTLVAAYLIGYKKMSANEAVELIKKNRPEIHVEEMQFEELRAFEKKQSLSSN